jgi:hypothetical protein
LALVDTLRDGTLNDTQRETLHALRAAILSLATQEPDVFAVKKQGATVPEAI